ncbi:MAG TPA: metallophosphoesterase [Kofleriaceae bacterium]|jgi:hypothetical protein|nr:metallophosphoesterase [Kofleriaceae bacterium]
MHHRSHSSRAALAALLAALGLAGCAGNDSGNLQATQLGDVSRPLERRSPVDELIQACGDGAATDAAAATLRREPYLQQVTSGSAIVGWVTTGTAGERVVVTTPAGEPVAEVAGAAEDTVVRSRGERQTWAKLDGLAADTVYCYALARGDQPLTARTGFRTAPAATTTRPIRFLAFGDSGWGETDQLSLYDQMLTVPYDLIVHVGDLAYPSGTIDQIEDTVFAIYAPLFRHLPFFPVAGNHEYKTDDAKPFRAVFALPNNERWYSFDWGPVHFVALDTEQDYGKQAAWLDADLAATRLPWKVVYMHKPLYSSGDHGSDGSARKAFEPLFEKHGVQLVLAGHDHHYERVEPQRGVAYFVTGGGGRGTRPTGSSSFTALSQPVIHFLQIEIAGDQLTVHAIDGAGNEFDSLVVPRVPVNHR